MLTNNIVSFEQLGPVFLVEKKTKHSIQGGYVTCFFFSSPEPKAQGEGLWTLTVRLRRRPSVRPSVHNL